MTDIDNINECDALYNELKIELGKDKYSPLSQDRFFQLWNKWINNEDYDARNEIIQRNMRYAMKLGVQWYKCQKDTTKITRVDFMQVAFTGLQKAIEMYDPSRGAFITCAKVWVNEKLSYHVNEKIRTIRLPKQKQSLLSKANRIIRKMREKDKKVDYISLGEQLDLTQAELGALLVHNNNSRTIAIYDFTDDLEASSIANHVGETFAPRNNCDYTELTSHLEAQDNMMENVMCVLSNNEKRVIDLIYGLSSREENITIKDVSDILKITPEYIRQLQKSALVKLRKEFEGKEHLFAEYFNI